jgi:uncharacterized protein GlcG (DUF336 family)
LRGNELPQKQQNNSGLCELSTKEFSMWLGFEAAEVTMRRCTARYSGVSVAVTNGFGDLKVFMRTRHAFGATIDVSRSRAQLAAILGKPVTKEKIQASIAKARSRFIKIETRL